MEKFCPVCGRGYDAAEEKCEDDGERLVIVSEEPSLIDRELEGKYRITAELGEGGMGSVYEAYQSTMDREVAVKVLKRQYCQNKLAIKRFLREARAASKLAHPNTITVYDFGQTADGLLYMVMEKLHGRPLADIMDEEGALHPKRAIHILSQVCDSLAEAHANGITHRDLKPENIFIEPKFGNPEHVKVLDFGIAKVNEEGTTQATATGMICGTPSYMSPEQAMGKEIDGRSDIYALGILLFEMLAAERPFDGDTAMEVMLKHLNELPPPMPPEVVKLSPRPLLALMHRMLAKGAAERPADCQTLKAELQAAIGTPQSPDSAMLHGPRRTRQPTVDVDTSFDKTGITGEDAALAAPKKNWALIGAVAALVVAGVVAVVIGVGGDADPVSAATRDTNGTSNTGRVVQRDQANNAESSSSPARDAVVVSPGDAASTAAASAKPPAAPGGTVPAEKAGAKGEARAATIAAGAVVGQAIGTTGAVAAELKNTPPVEMVNLSITSEPPGAYVWDGADLVGQTPLTLRKPKSSGAVELKVTAKGYADKLIMVGTVQSYTTTARLDSLTKAASRPRVHGSSSGRKAVKKKKRKKKSGGSIGTF